jgi:hypothetical protein
LSFRNKINEHKEIIKKTPTQKKNCAKAKHIILKIKGCEKKDKGV